MSLDKSDMPDFIKLKGSKHYQEEIDEWNTAVTDEAYAESDDYSYQGEFNPRNAVVTKKQETWNDSDIVKRHREGKPVIPVFSIYNKETGLTSWILTDGDALAVQAGYICGNCLEWQYTPGSKKCKWKNGGTCGSMDYSI